MASSKSSSNGSSGNWKGFVEVSIPKDVDISDIEEAAGGVDLEGAVEELVLSGYKVSFSQKGDGAAWICSVTGKEGSGANQGYTLSTWGSSIGAALLASWYKCAIICEWGQWAQESTEWRLEI